MRSVLIVEDEPALRKLLRAWLESAGLKVREASDGQELLAEVKREPPDLILLDIMMPGMDGWEALRQIRAMSLDIPVIVISAKDTYVDFNLAESLGVTDYFVKPFEVDELLSRIREVLRMEG